MIAAQCYIIDCDHGMAKGRPMREQDVVSMPVHIGEDFWLGAGCKVLKGSNIHNGVVVGAQSVVTGEINEDSVAVGVPAHTVKQRS